MRPLFSNFSAPLRLGIEGFYFFSKKLVGRVQPAPPKLRAREIDFCAARVAPALHH